VDREFLAARPGILDEDVGCHVPNLLDDI